MGKSSAAGILIEHIRRDGGTQIRAALDEDTVTEYAEAYRAKTALPALRIFFDGTDNWLVDGFHRVEAAQRAGLKRLPANIENGDRRSAILAACGANKEHGLRRSNADKHRSVETMLRDAEWSGWPDRRIARQCGVSHPMVSEVRAKMTQRVVTVTTSQSAKPAKALKSGQTGEGADAGPGESSPAPEKGDEGAGDQPLRVKGDGVVVQSPAPSKSARPRLEMDLLGLEIGDEIVVDAWELTETVLTAFDNHLRQAQAALASAIGRGGQDSVKLQGLRQATHELAARARMTAVPRTVCLYCKDPDGSAHRRSKCNGCGGIGYLVEEQLSAVPRELQARGADAKVVDPAAGGFVARDSGWPTPKAPPARAKRLQIQDDAGRELVTERDDDEEADAGGW